MKILLAADHAGFELKNKILEYLKSESFDVEDLGVNIYNKDDSYPEIILPVAMRIVNDPENTRAIVFGKSGQGEANICNRLPGVRATVYYGNNLEVIRLAREDNDSNVLSIGAKFVEEEEAKQAVKLWISTPFSNEPRHTTRNNMLDAIQ